MKILLDTHTWIWWNSDSSKLSPIAKKVLESAQYEELLLSAISIWEFSKLTEKGRLKLSTDGWKWIQTALTIPKLRVVPMTPEIAWHSTQLPKPIHDDPADQLIVSSARLENAVILTCDQLIRKYPHVRSQW